MWKAILANPPFNPTSTLGYSVPSHSPISVLASQTTPNAPPSISSIQGIHRLHQAIVMTGNGIKQRWWCRTFGSQAQQHHTRFLPRQPILPD
jgi:hypothetical protein